MKLLKNKTAIGITAIILGVLICFIFTPLYNRSIEAKTKVVRVVGEKIEKGQKITEDSVKVEEVGSYNLPDNVISKEEEVIGKYAASDLYPEDYLTENKLSETPLSNNEYLEGLDGYNGAVSVSVQSFAAGLSGKLLSGDIVSIIRTVDGTTDIPAELTYVKVLACTTSGGKDVDADTLNNKASDGEDEDDRIASTVTLLVNERQAETLANLETEGNIHIELIYRGTEENCNQFLEQQEKILEDMTGETDESAENEKAVSGSDPGDSGNSTEVEKQGGDKNE